MSLPQSLAYQSVTPSRLLLGLLAALGIVDLLWAILGDFSLDMGAYLWPLLIAAALLAGAYLHRTIWPDPRIEALLLGSGFLCAFSLGSALLCYFALTFAGPRIDVPLAALDRALGFDWPRVMAWMALHPGLNAAAYFAYSSMLPQLVLLLIVLAYADHRRIYSLCLGLALSALLCIAVWTIAPSFGAFSIYPPQSAFSHMMLAANSAYASDLVRMLQDGPSLISPRDVKGLIGFPSFHAAMALLVMWHARALKYLRWPAFILNGAVLAATPIQGGHHLVDVLAAVPLVALVLLVTGELAGRTGFLRTGSPRVG